MEPETAEVNACNVMGAEFGGAGSIAAIDRCQMEENYRLYRAFFADVMAPSELLLFLKFYDPATVSLAFVGTHVASMQHTLDDLLPALRALQRKHRTTGVLPVSWFNHFFGGDVDRASGASVLENEKSIENGSNSWRLAEPAPEAAPASDPRAPHGSLSAFLGGVQRRAEVKRCRRISR